MCHSPALLKELTAELIAKAHNFLKSIFTEFQAQRHLHKRMSK